MNQRTVISSPLFWLRISPHSFGRSRCQVSSSARFSAVIVSSNTSTPPMKVNLLLTDSHGGPPFRVVRNLIGFLSLRSHREMPCGRGGSHGNYSVLGRLIDTFFRLVGPPLPKPPCIPMFRRPSSRSIWSVSCSIKTSVTSFSSTSSAFRCLLSSLIGGYGVGVILLRLRSGCVCVLKGCKHRHLAVMVMRCPSGVRVCCFPLKVRPSVAFSSSP